MIVDFEKWINSYKVRVFPWIDGKHIYVNVQYYAPGLSISQPPAFDKTAYITDDEKGRNMIQNYLHTLVEYIARAKVEKGNAMYITVNGGGL